MDASITTLLLGLEEVNRAMSYHIRSLDTTIDLPRIVELVNTIHPEPVHEKAFRMQQEQEVPGRMRYTAVAVDERETIGGYVSIVRHSWMESGHFWARVIVDPALRHRGLGEFLYQHTLDFLRTQPATHLLSEVRDSCSEGLEFAQHRGFTIQRHLSVSRLYLAEFNPTPFARIVEAVRASGICFFTLADVEMTQENRRKFYELHRACATDNPAYEGWDFPDFLTFCHKTFNSPYYQPSAHLVAADGEDWIGLISLDHYIEQRSIHNSFTGVLRAYRGRHVALALKLLSISIAQGSNVDYLYTNNDSTNVPMLAINRRLGYRESPGIRMLIHAF
jgi:GNAT superfamily N-acetyltransferase